MKDPTKTNKLKQKHSFKRQAILGELLVWMWWLLLISFVFLGQKRLLYWKLSTWEI